MNQVLGRAFGFGLPVSQISAAVESAHAICRITCCVKGGDSTPREPASSTGASAGDRFAPSDLPGAERQSITSPFGYAQPDSASSRLHQADRVLAALIHVGPAMLVFATIASSGFLAPLPLAVVWIVWLLTRNRSVFLDDHGRESMNFQISIGIYAFVVLVAGVPTCSTAWWVGFPMLSVLALVGCILATRASLLGRPYRYPTTIRLISPAL